MIVAVLLETASVEREAILDDYLRGIRGSSRHDIEYVVEYREALGRLLDGLIPEPVLIRAAARLTVSSPEAESYMYSARTAAGRSE
jgi:hypothetical protein